MITVQLDAATIIRQAQAIERQARAKVARASKYALAKAAFRGRTEAIARAKSALDRPPKPNKAFFYRVFRREHYALLYLTGGLDRVYRPHIQKTTTMKPRGYYGLIIPLKKLSRRVRRAAARTGKIGGTASSGNMFTTAYEGRKFGAVTYRRRMLRSKRRRTPIAVWVKQKRYRRRIDFYDGVGAIMVEAYRRHFFVSD